MCNWIASLSGIAEKELNWCSCTCLYPESLLLSLPLPPCPFVPLSYWSYPCTVRRAIQPGSAVVFSLPLAQPRIPPSFPSRLLKSFGVFARSPSAHGAFLGDRLFKQIALITTASISLSLSSAVSGIARAGHQLARQDRRKEGDPRRRPPAS